MQMNMTSSRAIPLTLYEIEDNLEALASTVDLVEGQEAQRTLLEQIGAELLRAKDKRDSVVRFLRHCQAQQTLADEEIDRIRCRRDRIAAIQSELETYVVSVIERFAEPDRRGVKRLEGHVSSMRIQKNPDSAVIVDEQALPAAWKDLILTVPAQTWEALLQKLSEQDRGALERQIKRIEYRPDKRALTSELKTGTEIPGADLGFGRFRLVIA